MHVRLTPALCLVEPLNSAPVWPLFAWVLIPDCMKTAPKRVTQCEHEVYFLPLYYNDALDRHYSVSVLLMMCKLACSFVEYRFMDSTISSSSFSRTCTAHARSIG